MLRRDGYGGGELAVERNGWGGNAGMTGMVEWPLGAIGSLGSIFLIGGWEWVNVVMVRWRVR